MTAARLAFLMEVMTEEMSLGFRSICSDIKGSVQNHFKP